MRLVTEGTDRWSGKGNSGEGGPAGTGRHPSSRDNRRNRGVAIRGCGGAELRRDLAIRRGVPLVLEQIWAEDLSGSDSSGGAAGVGAEQQGQAGQASLALVVESGSLIGVWRGDGVARAGVGLLGRKQQRLRGPARAFRCDGARRRDFDRWSSG